MRLFCCCCPMECCFMACGFHYQDVLICKTLNDWTLDHLVILANTFASLPFSKMTSSIKFALQLSQTPDKGEEHSIKYNVCPCLHFLSPSLSRKRLNRGSCISSPTSLLYTAEAQKQRAHKYNQAAALAKYKICSVTKVRGLYLKLQHNL